MKYVFIAGSMTEIFERLLRMYYIRFINSIHNLWITARERERERRVELVSKFALARIKRVEEEPDVLRAKYTCWLIVYTNDELELEK